MTTEKDIEKLCGKARPFTVPEGYFENLTARVMSNLPEQGKVVQMPQQPVIGKSKRRTYWKEVATAIAACVAVVFVFVQQHSDSTADHMTAEANVAVYDQQYQEDMMEYAMMDNNDVYTYLSGEGY